MAWNPPKTCAGCGEPLRYPHITVSWGPCDCPKAEYRGHRKIRCNRDSCGAVWYEGGCDAQQA